MSLREQGREVLYLAHCCKLIEQAAWKAIPVNTTQMVNYMGYQPQWFVISRKPPKQRYEPLHVPVPERTLEQRLAGWLTTAGYELPMLKGALEVYQRGEQFGYNRDKCRELRKDIAKWERKVTLWKTQLAEIQGQAA